MVGIYRSLCLSGGGRGEAWSLNDDGNEFLGLEIDGYAPYIKSVSMHKKDDQSDRF